MNIILTESQIFTIKNRINEEKILRGEFENDIREFLKKLVQNPINPELPTRLSDIGINKKTLISQLIRLGVISKDEGFDEVSDGKTNKKFSQHRIKYTVHNQSFDSNIDQLYKSMPKLVTEEAGGAMGGGALGGCNVNVGTSDESAGIAYPFGGKGHVMRRKGYSPKEKSGGDVTKQKTNTVDMSPAMKRDTKHGIAMNRKK